MLDFFNLRPSEFNESINSEASLSIQKPDCFNGILKIPNPIDDMIKKVFDKESKQM